MYKKTDPETGEIFFTPYKWQKYKNKKTKVRVKDRRSYERNRYIPGTYAYKHRLEMIDYNRNRRKKFREHGLCTRCGAKIPEGVYTKNCYYCVKEAGEKR